MNPPQQPYQHTYAVQHTYSYQSVPVQPAVMQPSAPGYAPMAGGAMHYAPMGGDGYSMVKAPVINNRYKTQLCRHFASQGHCHLGDRCSFAHGAAEIRKPHDVRARLRQPMPSSVASTPVQVMPKMTYSNYKTVPCRFYEQGTCKYGDNCTYAHGDGDKRAQTDPLPSVYSGAETPGMMGGYYGGYQSVGVGAPLQNIAPPPAPESYELEIIHKERSDVSEKLREIRTHIDAGQFKEADEKVWGLYTDGFIVNVALYNQYQERMQKQQAEIKS